MTDQNENVPIDPKLLSKTFINKLQSYILLSALCEIVIADGEILGKIVEVGDDYVSLTRVVEKEISTMIEGEDGKKEKATTIELTELETTLKLADIKVVSRIVKKATR